MCFSVGFKYLMEKEMFETKAVEKMKKDLFAKLFP